MEGRDKKKLALENFNEVEQIKAEDAISVKGREEE